VKAVVKTEPGPGHLAYTTVPDPAPAPDEVVIGVRATGICGTDISFYDWAEDTVREYRPQPPVVMGHEFAGEVAAVGRAVRSFRLGDRVTANPIMYCRACHYCRTGRTNVCLDRPILGLGLPGCFAEYVAIREENVFTLPAGVPYDVAAMSEVLCVGLHAMERAAPGPGDAVAIIGPGPLGMILLVAARAAGAAPIVMIGLAADAERLRLAADLGAIALNAEAQDPVAAVRDITGGLGADIVFEAAGHPSAVPQALGLVRRGGRVGVLGLGHAPSSFNTADLAYREIELIGSRAYTPATWRRLPAMLDAQQSLLAQLATHRLPLEKAAEGIELMKARKGLKILFTPEWA
jgi:threonine dehydrogenase-like Zn-dependent dehydrogenase